VFGEKTAALRERYGVREYPVDVADGSAGDGDEIVPDAEKRFANDLDVVLKKQIEVLEHGSGETVLDGDHGRIYGLLDEFLEDVG